MNKCFLDLNFEKEECSWIYEVDMTSLNENKEVCGEPTFGIKRILPLSSLIEITYNDFYFIHSLLQDYYIGYYSEKKDLDSEIKSYLISEGYSFCTKDIKTTVE